ncbi:MAG TPA: hypothetical protein PLV87_05720 [Opitutaceae bacterium]|nr:hypothetical protein [Opitutaceae bacterium]
MGHLIPAGTGLRTYKHLRISLPFGEELVTTEEPAAVEEAAPTVTSA